MAGWARSRLTAEGAAPSRSCAPPTPPVIDAHAARPGVRQRPLDTAAASPLALPLTMLPTPSDLCISELDLSAPERLAVYEKALYQAFRKHPPGTFDTLWAFDPEPQRARILVPYAGQRIVVAEVAGELIGAVASLPLQLAQAPHAPPQLIGQASLWELEQRCTRHFRSCCGLNECTVLP